MMFTTVNMGLKNDGSSVQKLSFSYFVTVNNTQSRAYISLRNLSRNKIYKNTFVLFCEVKLFGQPPKF